MWDDRWFCGVIGGFVGCFCGVVLWGVFVGWFCGVFLWGVFVG